MYHLRRKPNWEKWGQFGGKYINKVGFNDFFKESDKVLLMVISSSEGQISCAIWVELQAINGKGEEPAPDSDTRT